METLDAADVLEVVLEGLMRIAKRHARPRAFEPALGKHAIDRELKKLRDTMSAHPALTFLKDESQTIGGFGRNDRFSYAQQFGVPGDVANRVLVEAGTASGREPTAVIEHFRRTFVEKMFAIHGKVQLMLREGRALGPYARRRSPSRRRSPPADYGADLTA